MSSRKTLNTLFLIAIVLSLIVGAGGRVPAQAQGKGQGPTASAPSGNGNGADHCKGKMRCYSKEDRQAARERQAPPQAGTNLNFAGVSSTAAGKSALTTQAGTLAQMNALATPDYFAVPNWANSPLPQIDGTGAIILGTGIRKFINTLPGICGVTPPNELGQCIPLAAADTASYPGSDFYRIGLRDYTQQLHTDLPATKIRGYVQLDANNVPVGPNQYLGPLILATRNRPVRVLFENQLAPNAGLFLPVDDTYMGAGMNSSPDGSITEMASEDRADLHLHGGNSIWISDGTPHQWVTPPGETVSAAPNFAKGVSFQNVPDMIGTGNLIPTPSLTDGQGTYFWTNQQSGRLMFYHDHAYGITRLNVYAGEAAGYLLVDPAQEAALAAATVPGTIVTDPNTGAIVSADLAHVIPLVIQDKTFVPDDGVAGGQLAATDPTWDVAKYGGKGSLWFPHVYMPNQNPYDNSGANPYGRWDYGAWFWPPLSNIVNGPVACTSAAYPNQALTCPGTPNPTGTPEAFMDTPVINGTAYPKLTVDPTAYRLQFLSVGNDRTLNLSLFVADPLKVSVTLGGSGYTTPPTVAVAGCTGVFTPTAVVVAGAVTAVNIAGTPACVNPTVSFSGVGTGAAAIASANTDVKMVPAVPAPARTLPDCTTPLPMGAAGLATGLLDGSGNPLNNTGLPAACWPSYTGPSGDVLWPVDGRDGGVPDPLTAGPPWIQIGTEGGLLPSAVVIPATAVSYDYNRRSITVLNVLNRGLFLGPAERADVIVDFSQFAGKTLIMYNDAPAPVPAFDPRVDYYTNDPDQTQEGGAPTTIAGYGPNTRTLMQITVNPTGPAPTFSLPTLAAALPGIFASTQEKIIVPETAYPPANGGAAADTYVRIQDTTVTAWVGAGIGGLTLTNGGAGYTDVPLVAIDPPATGTTATAIALLAPTTLAGLTLTSGGSGYTSAPTVNITGGGGTGARAIAVLSTRSVASATVTRGGNGYTSLPTVTFSAPPAGTTATGTAVVVNRRVTAITITNPGSGYVTAPTITISGGGGSGAAATANLAPTSVASIQLTAAGSGYTSVPAVQITGGGGTGAAAVANLTPTVVQGFTITNYGDGYTSAPAVNITGGGGTGASAIAATPVTPLQAKTIQELFTQDYGRMNALLGVEMPFTNFQIQTTIPYGYVDPPTEVLKDGEMQIWKITHNGVDTHLIHFHLFTVQVINRVGWDGMIKPPDANELAWKDTVRMNPLEDIIVAIRPLRQIDTLGITAPAGQPFQLPNSVRLMDVTMPQGSTSVTHPWEFLDVDVQNNPAAVTNSFVNYGWEFVWHCHILGHEENDMMRAVAFGVPPLDPGTPTAVINGSGNNRTAVVTWADNSINETGFTIQRANSAAGPWTTVGTAGPGVAGLGSYTDATVAKGVTYVYRIIANNVIGYTQTYAAPAVGYPNRSIDSAPSAPSNNVVP